MEDILALIYKQLPESNLLCVWEAVVREHTAVQLAWRCNLHSDSMCLPVGRDAVKHMHVANVCRWSRRDLRLTCATQVCIMLVYARRKICLSEWKIIRKAAQVLQKKRDKFAIDVSNTSWMYSSNLFFFPDCLILLRTCPFSSTEEFHIQADVIFQGFFFVTMLSPPPTRGFGFIGVRDDPGEPRDPPPQKKNKKRLSHMFSPVVAPIVFKIQDSIPEHDGPREGAKHSLCFCITEIQTRWAIQKEGPLCNRIGRTESTNKLMNLFATNHPPYPVNVLLM